MSLVHLQFSWDRSSHEGGFSCLEHLVCIQRTFWLGELWDFGCSCLLPHACDAQVRAVHLQCEPHREQEGRAMSPLMAPLDATAWPLCNEQMTCSGMSLLLCLVASAIIKFKATLQYPGDPHSLMAHLAAQWQEKKSCSGGNCQLTVFPSPHSVVPPYTPVKPVKTHFQVSILGAFQTAS